MRLNLECDNAAFSRSPVAQRLRARISERPNVLLVRLTSIGDCVLASSVSQALKRALPEARLSWVVQDRCRAVVEGNRHLERVFVAPLSHSPYLGYLRTLTALRRHRFDLALDLHGMLRASLLGKLSGATVCATLSTSRRASRLLADVVVDPGIARQPELHLVERYQRLLWALGIEGAEPELVLPVSDEERAWAARTLAEAGLGSDRPAVALVLGTSDPKRVWPLAHFARVLEWVSADLRTPPLLIGGPLERAAAEELVRLTPANAVNLVGRTTLPQLGALLSRCAAAVTGNTGPMHLAVAAKCPVVAVMNRDRYWHLRPYGAAHTILLPDPREAAGLPDAQALATISPDRVIASLREVVSPRGVAFPAPAALPPPQPPPPL